MANEWAIVKRVFTQAVELEPEKRLTFLKELRMSKSVRDEVESLLAHQDRTERILGIPSSIGERLISHYRVLNQIGSGGMGLIYKARDEKLGRLVAIKVLPPWAVGDPASRARLQEEARCAGTLNHPHIVTVYEIAHEKDLDFIVMEYIDGKTLDQHIPVRGLPLTRAMTWIWQIGSALEAAHALGIFHRDLKSSNVMVTRDQRTKLLDFGLALRPGGPRERPDFGTRACMAPELLSGNASADQRSEVFSFGLMLYQMLSGKKAFLKTELDSEYATPFYAPVPPSIKGHTAIAQTIRRCLEKDPDLRFQSISDVLSSLRSASDLVGQSAREPSTSPQNPGAVRELRAEIRDIRYADLAGSRRAFARITRLLETGASDSVRQTLVSAMKELLLRPPDSANGVSGSVREVRRLVLELLRKATQGCLGCFQKDDLEHLDLYGMNFSGVSLDNLSFRGAFLVEADFRGSALRSSSFSGASIRNANLTGADLTDCDFTDADWFHATGLTEDQLDHVRKHTLRACPSTIQEMLNHLSARYLFPFSSWNDHVQKQIMAAWHIYLQPGGLRDVIAGWRSLS